MRGLQGWLCVEGLLPLVTSWGVTQPSCWAGGGTSVKMFLWEQNAFNVGTRMGGMNLWAWRLVKEKTRKHCSGSVERATVELQHSMEYPIITWLISTYSSNFCVEIKYRPQKLSILFLWKAVLHSLQIIQILFFPSRDCLLDQSEKRYFPQLPPLNT